MPPRRGQAPHAYHLEELRLAREAAPRHRPPPMPAGARVLEVGCGAGQQLVVNYPDHQTVGIDIDASALALGRTLTTTVAFTRGMAEQLPFKNDYFDLVFARVSLPYTDINQSVREIHRVLKPGGKVWLMMHSLSLCVKLAMRGNAKSKLIFFYILANGAALHWFGRQFHVGRFQETFQTSRGMRRALERAGFSNIAIARDRAFIVTASCTIGGQDVPHPGSG